MTRRGDAFLVLAATLLAAATPSVAGKPTTVERIRYIGTVSYSRVVVDLSAPAEYRMESVPARGESVPNRLVIDVSGAKVGPEAREPLTVRDAMLRGIRTGQYTADTARIVLDLTTRAESTVFVLPDPYRLVIDLKGPGVAAGAEQSRIRRMDSGHGMVENRARP
ncbi:MAG: AMIN domain-containing protein, partial [Candidatus Binatia bacterium]